MIAGLRRSLRNVPDRRLVVAAVLAIVMAASLALAVGLTTRAGSARSGSVPHQVSTTQQVGSPAGQDAAPADYSAENATRGY